MRERERCNKHKKVVVKSQKISSVASLTKAMDEAKVTLKIGSSAEGEVKEDQKSVQSSINHVDNCNEAKMDVELESARSEMGEVREENERLKMKLKQIEKDYQNLKRRFLDILQQESNKKSKDSSSSSSLSPSTLEEKEEHELVSLSLGRSPSDQPKKYKEEKIMTSKAKEDQQQLEEDITLGLELKSQMSSSKPEAMEIGSIGSGENSFEEANETAGGETWPPSEVFKTMKGGLDNNEASQQNHVKRARVSVRARCDAPTMNDGCQWRKYGQKISKGNPCPRAYYRCTVAPACPVRKQVQRCHEDMSILITTYEGTHSHPLPRSATAMASTTSAAASMLLSGSSTSTQGLGASAAADHHHLHGLMNFNQFDNSRQRQLYVPNSSTSPAFPTITLDLTATSPSSSSSTLFNRLSSRSLSFSSSESNILPTLWNNNISHINHGTFPYNKSQLGSFNFGTQSQNHVYQAPPQQLLTETLTKAITSDPSFRTVIAAAISSIAGGAGKNQGGGDSFGQNLKCGEQMTAASSNALTHNSKGCASGYLDRTSSANPQRGSLMLLQPPFPFSISKGTSAAPAAASDNRDELNLGAVLNIQPLGRS